MNRLRYTLSWIFAALAVSLMCHEAWLNGYRCGLRLGMGTGLDTLKFLQEYKPHGSR